MCGIVGIVGKSEFSVKKELLKSLQRLEYRGYDSSGFVTQEGFIIKKIGNIRGLIDLVDEKLKTKLGIAHSRWATHGGITETNAHPHFNTSKTIFVVHNGIIENFKELKEMLEEKGYKFITQTDTEIIPHYFDFQFKQGNDFNKAAVNFMKDVKGTFAILLFRKSEDKIYALKRDSPLVLGLMKDKFIIASDIYAFSDSTDKAIFFEDDEFASITSDGFVFYDKHGKEIKKEIKTFKWARIEETKDKWPHYMIKEIHEQPETSLRLINSFETIQKNNLKKFVELIKKYKEIVFIAAGTSYHASLVGSAVLNKLGFVTRTTIASEAENFITFDKDTLCIAVSQSGETMDVISVLKHAKEKGSKIVSIVNVPHSTIQRLSEVSIEILAGQEICVAATKTFTNQLITLFMIAKELGYEMDFSVIPDNIKETIEKNEEKIKNLAKELYKKNDVFVLGRNMSYPVAREIALKLKEIPYVHAEGMMAGELKHGTIALIEEGTPVISLIPNNDVDMISSTKEVEARGARVIEVSNVNGELHIPKSCDAEFAIYAGLIGHLLAYEIGVLRGVSIDKPRNLAKVCTVK